MPRPPVLLVAFNRPEVTRRMVGALRENPPSRLFVAADGPRADRPTDASLCAATRRLIDGASWPCPVERLYRDENLGLQASMIGALDWFFEQVDAGVVLEDDCLPSADFLPFAGEILERYTNEPRVMHVSGLNMAPGDPPFRYSYGFASIGHVWGWATWRRAWRLHDPTLAGWPALRAEYGFRAPPLRRALGRKFGAAHAGRKSTWSRSWSFAIVRHGGLAVIPSLNMIENIGFGADATHTRSGRHPLRREASGAMRFPLTHPPDLSVEARYERHLARYHARSYRDRVLDLAGMILDGIRGGRGGGPSVPSASRPSLRRPPS